MQIARFSGFAQWSNKSKWNDNEIWYNIGLRAQNWSVSGDGISSSKNQTVISPRAQIAIKPN